MVLVVKNTTVTPRVHYIRIHTEMTEKKVLKLYNTHTLFGHCLNSLLLHTLIKGVTCTGSATVLHYHSATYCTKLPQCHSVPRYHNTMHSITVLQYGSTEVLVSHKRMYHVYRHSHVMSHNYISCDSSCCHWLQTFQPL